MKEIVVISGKGGTGKTSITGSFAFLAGKDAIVADCDVDAANLHILTGAEPERVDDFYSGYEAKIDLDKCTHCNICNEVCEFDAIPDDHIIDEFSCEGCGYCARVCPEEAITMSDAYTGKLRISKTRFGSTLVHADLAVTGENSGKLVTEVKKTARKLAKERSGEIILVDGPPGIGCPVLASLSGASFVLIVTEATTSGFNDMERVYDLTRQFKIPCGVLINKADLDKDHKDKITAFCKGKNVPVIAEIPYDRIFTEAMKKGNTVVEFGENAVSGIIEESWQTLRELLAD